MKQAEIIKAVQILKQGGVVVYPTDTAYGLAVDAINLAAVKRLFRLKGRDFHRSIHVILPSKSWIATILRFDRSVKSLDRLMSKFWPGPLTIVLPLKARGESWKILSGGSKTIGIRYPNNSTAQALVEALGRPITTTSANVSGGGNTYSIEEVMKQFANCGLKPDYYLDGGKLKKIKPSTIVSIINNNVTILRQGPISEKEIKRALK